MNNDSIKQISLAIVLSTIVACGGGGGSSPNIEDENRAPEARNISVSDVNGGAVLVEDVLEVSFEYFDRDGDSEGNSVHQWLRDGIEIEGQSADQYTIQPEDSGREISVSITPIATSGVLTGNAVISTSLLVANSKPTVTNLKILDADEPGFTVGSRVSISYEYSDVDGDEEGASTFKWYRDGNLIESETSNDYILTQEDVGFQINASVTPVAATGNTFGDEKFSPQVMVNNTAPVVINVNLSDANEAPTVVGDVLQLSYEYFDEDGDPEGETSIQWFRDESRINGELDLIYTLTEEDSGHSISAKVTPMALQGVVVGSAYSSNSILIDNSAPSISNLNIVDLNGGTLVVNEIIEINYDYSDVDGDQEGNTIVEWYRNGVVIAGESGRQYILENGDNGASFYAEVTPVASSGTSHGETVVSATLNTTENNPPTVSNLTLLDVNGENALVGDRLEAQYSYQDSDNDLEGSSIFEWLRNGQVIENADAPFYMLTADDAGHDISLRITPKALTGIDQGDSLESPSISVSIAKANPQQVETLINQSTQIILDGESADGDALEFEIISFPENGIIEGTAPHLTYIPQNNMSGVEKFEFIVRDGSSESLAAVVEVTINDPAPPDVSLIFPLPNNLYDGETIIIRGTASDSGEVDSVKVGDVEADSSDGFKTWSAEVNLTQGTNLLPIVATGWDGDTAAIDPPVIIENRDLLTNIKDIDYNQASNKIYLSDDDSKSLYSFDLSNDKYEKVFEYKDDSDEFSDSKTSPGLVVNEGENAAFLIENHGEESLIDRIWRVDLNTFTSQIVTEDEEAVAPHTMIEPVSLGTNSTGSNLFVFDRRKNEILKTVIATGETSIFKVDISSNAFGTDFLLIDSARERALKAEAPRIYSIDLNTGEELLFTGPGVTGVVNHLSHATAFCIDPIGSRLMIFDRIKKQIVGADLNTGEQSVLISDLSLTGVRFDIACNPSRNQILLVDQNEQEINSIDIVAGTVTVLSSNSIPDSNNSFGVIQSVELLDENTALVTDFGNRAIIKVDLLTGSRSILADENSPESDFPMGRPLAIQVVSGGKAYYSESEFGAIAEINTVTGVRKRIVDSADFQLSQTFHKLGSVDVSMDDGLAYVLDTASKRIIQVNHATGERLLISSNHQPVSAQRFVVPKEMVISEGFAYVIDFRKILKVDLNSGERTLFFGNGIPFPQSILNDPLDIYTVGSSELVVAERSRLLRVSLLDGSLINVEIHFDGSDESSEHSKLTVNESLNEAYTLNTAANVVFSKDLLNGSSRAIAGVFPSGERSLFQPKIVEFDSTTNQLYVIAGESIRKGLYSISAIDGKRELVLNRYYPKNLPSIPLVSDIEKDGSDIFILSNNSQSITRVNTESDELVVVSDGNTPNDENPLQAVVSFTLNSEKTKAYVLGNNQVITVDLATGERTILSDNDTPNGENPLSFLKEVKFDSNRNRLIVSIPTQLIAIDIETGERTNISSNLSPNDNNRFFVIQDFLIDDENERIIVVDQGYLNALISVDINTGERTILAQNRSNKLSFSNPTSVSKTSNESIYAITDRIKGVILVDVETGERVIISK